MKQKLFTLLALLLCAVTSTWAAADITYSIGTDLIKQSDNITYKWQAGTEMKAKNKVVWVEVPGNNVHGSITFYGSSTKEDRYFYIYKTNGTVKDTRKAQMQASSVAAGTIDYTSDDILTDNSKYYLVFSTSDDFKAKNIDYTAEVDASDDKPTITVQPQGAIYQVGATPAALTVDAIASAGTLTYQWYSTTSDAADPDNDTAIDGATTATLAAGNISTASVNTTNYYVVVTDDNGSEISDLATIEVVTEEAPEVSASASATVVRTGTEVTLTATLTAGIPTPTLQWYSCDDADGTNAQAIDGETESTFVFTPSAVGTLYYLVKASNSAQADVASNVITINVFAGGTAGTVDDLVAVSEGYVFVADDVTGNGTLSPTANTLYDNNKIFTSGAFTVATNKGSNTFAGASHLNSMRLKNTSDYIAFKVDDACVITFYVENPNKGSRHFKVGSVANDDSYGTIPDGQTTASIIIPEAGMVYVTGPGGDRYLGGFEVKSTTETITPAKKYTTFSSTMALDFSAVEGLEAYAAVSAASGKVRMTKVTDIPANTGLVLKKTGTATSYNVPVGTATSLGVDNKLVAATTATAIEAYNPDNNVFNYILKDGEFHPATDGTLAAGKAYLSLDASAGQQGLVMEFDDAPTAVEAVAEAKVNVNVPVKVIKNGQLFIGNYNVAGARVK
ncbi:MAG: hypothetical protein IKO28_02930 [Prevotella sp.]|nr:hypothetical protein [Prevotella sp.]